MPYPPQGIAGVTKHAELTDVSTPHVDADIADITDAWIAAANKDGLVGTASMRTLGVGAQQAAAGNHTHTLVEDIVGSALTTITLTTSGGAWSKITTLASGADLIIATKTQTYNAQSRAVSVGMFYLSANTDSIKVRHFMGGVQVEETAYIGAGDMFIMTYTRALSGSQECKLVAHNYYGSDRVFTTCGFQSGNEGAIGIAVGSIKT